MSQQFLQNAAALEFTGRLLLKADEISMSAGQLLKKMQFSTRVGLLLLLVFAIAKKSTKENEVVEEILAEEGNVTEESDSGTIKDQINESQEQQSQSKGEEEEIDEVEKRTGIRDPKPCEVCKYLAVELQGRLEETGRVKEYIETGHGIMPGDRKKKAYHKSELRLIEAVSEPHVCEKILDYDIHAERKKSLRYAKGPSETRRTLHALVDKGVKVELGIPYEIWKRDSPPTEITHLQSLCFDLVEAYEEDIEDWYWGHQDVPLLNYLCIDRALKNKDTACLNEQFVSKGKQEEEKDTSKVAAESLEGPPNNVDDADTPAMKGDQGTPENAMPPLTTPSVSAQQPDIQSPSRPLFGSEAIKDTSLPGVSRTIAPTVPASSIKTESPVPSSQSISKDEL